MTALRRLCVPCDHAISLLQLSPVPKACFSVAVVMSYGHNIFVSDGVRVIVVVVVLALCEK